MANISDNTINQMLVMNVEIFANV